MRAIRVSEARAYLEPGPVVLVSSQWRGRRTVMTMGWHLVLETEPSLVGCYLWTENLSRELIAGSRECVINLPSADLGEAVVGIGNASGRDIDKFAAFGLTPARSRLIAAPGIAECHARFECRVVDTSLARRFSFFVLEVVAARARTRPRFPTTLHYRGDGRFMISGPTTARYRRRFRPDRL